MVATVYLHWETLTLLRVLRSSGGVCEVTLTSCLRTQRRVVSQLRQSRYESMRRQAHLTRQYAAVDGIAVDDTHGAGIECRLLDTLPAIMRMAESRSVL
jgi:hypothetical protein